MKGHKHMLATRNKKGKYRDIVFFSKKNGDGVPILEIENEMTKKPI